MFSLASNRARKRRELTLAECRIKDRICREHVLDLVQRGVSKDDPEFVAAFTSARNAHKDYQERLCSNVRLDSAERNVAAIRRRIEEQRDRKTLLDLNRRYLDPNLPDLLDSREDDIEESEQLLGETAEGLKLSGVKWEDVSQFDEEDEALLAKWTHQMSLTNRTTGPADDTISKIPSIGSIPAEPKTILNLCENSRIPSATLQTSIGTGITKHTRGISGDNRSEEIQTNV